MDKTLGIYVPRELALISNDYKKLQKSNPRFLLLLIFESPNTSTSAISSIAMLTNLHYVYDIHYVMVERQHLHTNPAVFCTPVMLVIITLLHNLHYYMIYIITWSTVSMRYVRHDLQFLWDRLDMIYRATVSVRYVRHALQFLWDMLQLSTVSGNTL